jgi:hypothetical protein
VQRRLTQYFDSTPPSSVNVDGVMAALRQAWKDIQATPSAEIKLKATQRVGASAKAGVDIGGGAVVGVGASVALEHTIERIIYTWKGGSGGGAPPVPVPPVVPPVPVPDPIHPPPPPPTPPDDPGRKRPTLAEVLAMSPAQFKEDTLAHDVLWDGATDLRNRMAGFGEQMIQNAGAKGTSVALRKRDNKEEFIQLVIEKCERKKYERVGQMDDIARGRFNMSAWEGVTGVVDALRVQSDYPLYPDREKGIQGPRRPQEGGGFGYPRFHVIVLDSTSLTFEWQVGTAASTKVFETEGIVIPPGVDKPHHTDLHDVEYDVLKPIQEGCPDVAAKHGIPAFRADVDKLAAISGEKGDEILGPDGNLKGPEKKELERLMKVCGDILQSITDEHGPEYINTVMRLRKCIPPGIHPPDEKEKK